MLIKCESVAGELSKVPVAEFPVATDVAEFPEKFGETFL
jgi:hypothetical protein